MLSSWLCNWSSHNFEEVDIHPSFQWSKYECSRCGEVKLVNPRSEVNGYTGKTERDMFPR